MELVAYPSLWTAISLVGSPVAMAVLCVLLVLALLRFGNVHAASACVLIAGLGGLLNTFLKAFVHRPRPPGADRFLYGHSWSFPSGHAMGSLIGYGMLAYCALTYTSLNSVAKRAIVAACALLVLAVGYGRVALGVHYRGDVIGGWIIGAVWLTAGIALLRSVESRRPSTAGAGVTPER